MQSTAEQSPVTPKAQIFKINRTPTRVPDAPKVENVAPFVVHGAPAVRRKLDLDVSFAESEIFGNNS